MKAYITGAALAAALCMSSAAHAVTFITQTLNFNLGFSSATNPGGGGSQTLSYNLFNGSPDKLLGVTILWTPSFSGSITGNVNSGNRPTITGRLGSTLTLSSPTSAFTTISNPIATNTITRTGVASGAFTLTPLTTTLAPTSIIGDTADFLGSGTASVTMTLANITRTTTTSGGSVNFASHSGNAGGTYTIIYEVLPDPGTWATMILGFGMVGTAMRRRRKSAIATQPS